VVGAAPDDQVRRAARRLARPGAWSETGSTDALVWGRCQGSGSTPYQVSVDLTGPVFRCSCPSRKQPCKHGVALLLLWVEGDGSVADVDTAPPGVGPARPAAPAKKKAPVDREAQNRRRENRLALMDAGLEDFERWLGDLVRQGLAAARHRPYSFWDGTAARLVDAQVPGLAERVREAAGLGARHDDWAERLTAEVGRWYLAVQAWRRRDALDPATRGDLRVVLGWPVPSEDVLAGDRVADRWLVAGVHRTDDGRLQSQRTWLLGTSTRRWALVLDFAVTGASLRVPQTTGSVVEAELALYPGSGARRALFATGPDVVGKAGDLDGGVDVAGALDLVADAVAANPWTPRVPVVLAGVVVTADSVVDGEGAVLPLTPDPPPWPALAVTGGRPASVFGEWEHGSFRVLTAAADGSLVPL
jgi:hypothetical protein